MRRTFWVGLGLLTLIGVVALGVVPRLQRKAALAAETSALAGDVPAVDTAVVHASGQENNLVLPGSMQAVQEVPVYARTSGYLRERTVDIGDRVHAAALLGVIESPEVDQELAQARANVAHAQAAQKQAAANLARARSQLQLAKVTLKRWKQLAGEGVVSKQDADDKQGAFDAASALVDADTETVNASESDIEAQRANVRRLEQLQGFERITAPFEGVITARNYDAGALISAGTGAKELYRLASIGELRVFVGVPQPNAGSIRVGMSASVQVGEFAGKQFPGRVVRTADALDPASRTLLTEVHIANAIHILRPGMFASVRFALGRGTGSLVAPASAVSFGSGGPHVALVRDGRVHIAQVVIGRDLGGTLEVVSGLVDGDRVVLNPGDDLKEGVAVVYARGDAR